MNFRVFENWLSSRIAVKSRLKKVCLCFVMFLMIETRKHSLQEAARFWGMNKSQFSKFRPRQRTPKRCDFFGHKETHDEEEL